MPRATGSDAAEAGVSPLQPWIPIAATIAAVVLCSAHALVADADTPRAAGVGYLSTTIMLFGCAWAFWRRSRSAQGRLRIRWRMIAAAAMTASLGYAPSVAECMFGTPSARQLQGALLNSSEGIYMLSAVLFFAGVARSIVIVDILQALLFVVLRFRLYYSPVTQDHFALDHLLVGQLVALFLFLTATVACVGAASRAELGFLRALSWFFGLRLIDFFLANEVCYTWLHHENSGLWDVPGTVLLAGYALYMIWTSRTRKAEEQEIAPLSPPGVAVRSLMPSFLALVNLMLGLFLLRVSIRLAAAAISVSVICYVVRTVLLQSQALRENTQLENRNAQLEGLAVRDPLTGIGNRRSLAGVYSKLQAAAAGEGLSLLLMDIDSFKQANDNHGHLHGDRVLVMLARRLENLAAGVTGSHCARLGGDEFALLLPGIAAEAASALAEKLRMLFGAHEFEAQCGTVSLSIGVASLTAARDLPLEALVSQADEALYRAKLLGRDRVEAQPMGGADETVPELTISTQSIVTTAQSSPRSRLRAVPIS